MIAPGEGAAEPGVVKHKDTRAHVVGDRDEHDSVARFGALIIFLNGSFENQ